jgi:hypothetical protein
LVARAGTCRTAFLRKSPLSYHGEMRIVLRWLPTITSRGAGWCVAVRVWRVGACFGSEAMATPPLAAPGSSPGSIGTKCSYTFQLAPRFFGNGVQPDWRLNPRRVSGAQNNSATQPVQGALPVVPAARPNPVSPPAPAGKKRAARFTHRRSNTPAVGEEPGQLEASLEGYGRRGV